MGKTKNKKRNKLLRQRKKEREALKNMQVPGHAKIEKRLAKIFEGGVKVRNNNKAKVKISNVVLQMVDHLMKNAKSFKEEKNIVGMGVMAWNLGIVKMHKGENEMLENLKEFKSLLTNDTRKLLMEFVEIKCTEYGEYDQIIYDFEFKRINDNHNNLRVAYKPVNEK